MRDIIFEETERCQVWRIQAAASAATHCSCTRTRVAPVPVSAALAAHSIPIRPGVDAATSQHHSMAVNWEGVKDSDARAQDG